jgi:GTP pyrophosphokinase
MTPYNLTTLEAADLEEALSLHLPPIDIHRVMSAYDMAMHVHEFQKRNDDSPYFFHCARVCKIILHELRITDPDILIAALTHDVLEDSQDITPEVLAYNFGDYAAYLVQTLTKDLQRHRTDPETVEQEHLELLRRSSADCLIIKLAARLDNFRCLEYNLKRNPLLYVNSTTELYLPLADSAQNPYLEYLASELRRERNKFLG